MGSSHLPNPHLYNFSNCTGLAIPQHLVSGPLLSVKGLVRSHPVPGSDATVCGGLPVYMSCQASLPELQSCVFNYLLVISNVDI